MVERCLICGGFTRLLTWSSTMVPGSKFKLCERCCSPWTSSRDQLPIEAVVVALLDKQKELSVN
jgi:hypothetical protein